MIRREWKRLFHNKVMLVVIIAIIIIPTIYTTLFLASMWDPYGKLDQLPVAVVNLDKEVTYGSQVLDIGNDLVESLKENASLQFNIVDSDTAKQGLENGYYYMVITIPEDFSSNASTVMDEESHKMELLYSTNPAHNYIASKMSETAVNKIKESINTEVTKVYINSIFDLITEVSDGMVDASDGAGKLYDGLTQVKDGVTEYTDGVTKVAAGTSELAKNNEALNQAVSQLSLGIGELRNGSEQLANGLDTMSASIGSTLPKDSDITALGNGLDAYQSGLNQLNASLSNVSLGNQNEGIGKSLTNIGSSTQAAASDVAGIGKALEILSKANLTKEQALALQTIAASTKELGGHLATIGTETKNVSGGLTELSSNLGRLDELKSAVGSLAGNSEIVLGGSKAAVNGLYNGLSKVKETLDNQIIPGGLSLNQGITKVEAAMNQANGLKDGISSYTEAVTKLDEGVAILDNKSKDLIDGVTKLGDGSDELYTALKDGAKEMKASVVTDGTIDMIAAPIELDGTQITKMANNGHAMSVYMMSVALWVGCIAFCIMYPLTNYEGEMKSGFAWFISKTSIAYLVAIAQAIVMIIMLKQINGFQPEEMGKTIFIACLSSLAFMSLIYFFNACFGKIGSFIMLIYMVVQLSGSAGTYPIELSGAFVDKIHKYLPFSYSIDAFRSTISGSGSAKEAVLVLSMILIVCTILTILIFNIRAIRIKKGKSFLFEILEKDGLA